MKILYALQATGNGHISRAMEIMPYLKAYGEVDVFLSGSNSTLNLNLPIKYRSKGLSLFYSCKGGINYFKTTKALAPWRIYKEARDLPVEKYDLVLNDFDCITSMACGMKKIHSVSFGHQASFNSNQTPRPDKKNLLGEWILQNYAKATQYIGLHFDRYDQNILHPVIKDEIWKSQPTNQQYITVYLPSYCQIELIDIFTKFPQQDFQIFSWQVNQRTEYENITFLPVSKEGFNKSLINCYGIITGAGFETPAEALYLQKKIMAIPIKGQYEQHCNGAALQQLGAVVLKDISDDFEDHFTNWMNNKTTTNVRYTHSAKQIVELAMNRCCTAQESKPEQVEFSFY